MIISPSPFEQCRQTLAASGLVLCEVRSLDSLPDTIWLAEPELQGGSLLLLGHAGREFWQAYKQADVAGSDPVDDFSSQISERALKQYFPDVSRKQLFPAKDCPINLMALGKAINWHRPSPLGMGIHSKYGLWSAYRALWWLDSVDLALVNSHHSEAVAGASFTATDVCAECQTQECIAACPASALIYQQAPDLSRCADFRLAEGSACASTCLSRMACPHGAEHRYSSEQMSYHYDLALSAMAAYRSEK